MRGQAQRWHKSLIHLALVVLGVAFAFPLFWMLTSSLKTDAQLFAVPVRWIPNPVTVHNYLEGFRFVPFLRYLTNSLTVCLFSVMGTLLSCSLVAYSLSHLRWKGRDLLFYVLIATMMLPGQVTMVPLFVIFARLGWVDTFLPLIVPHFFGSAFYIFLMRQFFLSIPGELVEAAQVDGCSFLGTFCAVIIPLSKPVLATVALFTFMATWNDFLGPLIYLSDESKYTLSLGLATFSSQYGSFYGMMLAMATVMTLPIIVFFFFGQRTFVQGMTTSGIKG